MNRQSNTTILEEYFANQSKILAQQYQSSSIAEHNPDTGSNRENILINWLNAHLPRMVHAQSGGKIIDSFDNRSKQVDVIVYDSRMPTLGGNEKTYFFVEGVVAAIEVKSELNKKSLSESLVNISSIKSCQKKIGAGIFVGGQPKKVPLSGVFAFTTSYTSHEALLSELNTLSKEIEHQPDFICINGKVFVMYLDREMTGFDKDGNEQKLQPGYIFASNEEQTIWRMLFQIITEGRTSIGYSFDMQAYFMKGMNGN